MYKLKISTSEDFLAKAMQDPGLLQKDIALKTRVDKVTLDRRDRNEKYPPVQFMPQIVQFRRGQSTPSS